MPALQRPQAPTPPVKKKSPLVPILALLILASMLGVGVALIMDQPPPPPPGHRMPFFLSTDPEGATVTFLGSGEGESTPHDKKTPERFAKPHPDQERKTSADAYEYQKKKHY